MTTTSVEDTPTPSVRARWDEAELARLYTAHAALVGRLAVRFGAPAREADDVVHDVFVELATGARPTDGASERAFVVALTRHVVLRRRRAWFRHVRRVLAFATGRAEEVVESPDDTVARAHALHALLDALDDEKRAVFVLIELEDWTAPEVAESLGLKLPTVYSRLRAAKAELVVALGRRRARERRES